MTTRLVINNMEYEIELRSIGQPVLIYLAGFEMLDTNRRAYRIDSQGAKRRVRSYDIVYLHPDKPNLFEVEVNP